MRSRGANVRITDTQGWTLLHMAINYPEEMIDRIGMVKTILGLDGISPDIIQQPEPACGASPLHWAAYRGYVDIVDVLLERGARIDSKNNDGEVPLHVAARAGQKDAFLKLKDANLDLLNAVDNEGRTPIVTAQKHNSQGILSVLGL